jgi:uncharacterized protein YecE (DUF72 family)
MTEAQFRARVGTSGWKKPQWRGHFYPPGLVQRGELEYAADRLTSIEINTTFHGRPRPSNYLDWRAETPNDFVFSVKGSETVTHQHRLENPAKNVADFLASGVLFLQEKMRPVLWQIPSSLSFQRDTVDAFLAVLPHSVGEARQLIKRHSTAAEADQVLPDTLDHPIRHCFEVRNASFLNPVFPELLHRHDVAAVVTNSPRLARYSRYHFRFHLRALVQRRGTFSRWL